jgi:hypothetical protein
LVGSVFPWEPLVERSSRGFDMPCGDDGASVDENDKPQVVWIGAVAAFAFAVAAGVVVTAVTRTARKHDKG